MPPSRSNWRGNKQSKSRVPPSISSVQLYLNQIQAGLPHEADRGVTIRDYLAYVRQGGRVAFAINATLQMAEDDMNEGTFGADFATELAEIPPCVRA